MTILESVRSWSAIAPSRVAHISSGSTLTFGELEAKSNSLAAYLASSLPESHLPVAVNGHKEPEMLVAFLATIKAGHPYIPIDDSLPQPRIDRIIERSRAVICLTPERIRQVLSSQPDGVPQYVPRPIQPGDPWYIIFTSGSTGEPKGVVITAGSLEGFVSWMLDEQKLSNQQEVFLNQAPFSFDLSVMDLYLSLVTGGTLFSINRDEIADPRQLFLALAGSHVTVWVSTPSFAGMCLLEPTFSAAMLPQLRKFLFCGETLPPEIAAALLQRFPAAQVWNTYGPTETTCATTSVQITPAILSHYSPLPVGYPRPDGRIAVLKADGTPARDDEHGEIIIAGPNVSPGYLNQPDLTRKAFFDLDGLPAYHTGDQGHFHEGMVFFDGRQDHQIKLHGYRIELGDIEANLMAMVSVQEAIVLPCYKNGQPFALAAYVTLKNSTGQKNTEIIRALKKELGDRLPAYMVPRYFHFLSQFPLTTNGKVDRRKLAESVL